VACSDTGSESDSAVASIARAVDRRITESAHRPPIVGILPQNDLRKATYCKGLLGLSTLYFFDTKEVFHAQECAAGIYAHHTLLVFSYPDSGASSDDFRNVRESLAKNARFTAHHFVDSELLLTDRTDRALCISRVGRYVLVGIASDYGRAEDVCKAMREVL